MLVSFFGLSMAAGAVFFCVEGAQLIPVLDLALPRSLPAWGVVKVLIWAMDSLIWAKHFMSRDSMGNSSVVAIASFRASACEHVTQ